jgi:hypothetical protein
VVHAIAQLGVRIQRSNDHLYGRARHNINPLHNWGFGDRQNGHRWSGL